MKDINVKVGQKVKQGDIVGTLGKVVEQRVLILISD